MFFKKQLNLASWISISRLFMLPAAIVPVTLGLHYCWFISASVTTMAGLADIFDGYLARKMREITILGAHLDLISDKIFVGGMLLLLSLHQVTPWWIFFLVLLREIVITILRFSRRQVGPLTPDAWGKAKTAVSIVALVWLLLEQDFNSGGLFQVVNPYLNLSSFLSLSGVALLAAVALTLVSGFNYLLRFTPQPWASEK